MITLAALFQIACMPFGEQKSAECFQYHMRCYEESVKRETILKPEPQKAQAVMYCMRKGGYVKFQ